MLRLIGIFSAVWFLPRYIHCMQRGLAMRKVSVRLSVWQTCAFWQNGKKICQDFYTVR